jgi:predicted transcriptional regulator
MIDLRLIMLGILGFIAIGSLVGAYRLGNDYAALEGELKAERVYAAAEKAAREQAEENLRIVNVANERNAIQAREDALAITRLEEQAHDTPVNLDRCLDRDAAQRVRAIR